MSANKQDEKPTNLWVFIETLMAGEIQPLPTTDDEMPPWYQPGVVSEIDEKTYWYFLELLPPRWINGNWFAFGEGAGPFRLFWQLQGSYFAREMTDEETQTFCELGRVRLYE